jgi:hypothetical protein
MLVRFELGGLKMAVVIVHQGPTLTQEKYDEIVRRFTEGRGRMESPSDWPVEGLLVHAAGQGEQGFRVVDVWDSEEAAKRFGDVLMPILQEIGVDEQPEIYPTHAFVSA